MVLFLFFTFAVVAVVVVVFVVDGAVLAAVVSAVVAVAAINDVLVTLAVAAIDVVGGASVAIAVLVFVVLVTIADIDYVLVTLAAVVVVIVDVFARNRPQSAALRHALLLEERGLQLEHAEALLRKKDEEEAFLRRELHRLGQASLAKKVSTYIVRIGYFCVIFPKMGVVLSW